MTSLKMNTNRVTALEPYIPFIQDYSYALYSWSRSLHLLIRTRSFSVIKISNSLHSLYVRVEICVMTYLKVEGQGQIDISKIAIFSICY